MKNNLLNIARIAVFSAFAYYGLYVGSESALNILKFYIWVICPFMVLALFGADMLTTAQRADARNKLVWAPIRFTHTVVGFFVVFALAGQGHFATAVALFATTLCGMAVTMIIKKE